MTDEQVHQGDDLNGKPLEIILGQLGSPASREDVEKFRCLIEGIRRDERAALVDSQAGGNRSASVSDLMTMEDDAIARTQDLLRVLTDCDSVLSYIYYRERYRLTTATQGQLYETMMQVQRLTRKRGSDNAK